MSRVLIYGKCSLKENQQITCLCFLTSLKEGEDQKEITIEPAQALDEVEPLPEDCYTRPISLPEGRIFVKKHLLITLRRWLRRICVCRCVCSDHAAPAAAAAGLPACRSFSAPPQTQTPADEAFAALQGQYSSAILRLSNGLIYFSLGAEGWLI